MTLKKFMIIHQEPRGAENWLRCASEPVEPEPDNAGGGKDKLL